MTEQATVSVGAIAKKIGLSGAKKKKAIEALNIAPVGKRGVCKLYAADVVRHDHEDAHLTAGHRPLFGPNQRSLPDR